MSKGVNNGQCFCGGDSDVHFIGEEKCLREFYPFRIRKVSCTEDYWMVGGHRITGYTLRQQRGFYYHAGIDKWSRPKSHESFNSLPDET